MTTEPHYRTLGKPNPAAISAQVNLALVNAKLVAERDEARTKCVELRTQIMVLTNERDILRNERDDARALGRLA